MHCYLSRDYLSIERKFTFLILFFILFYFFLLIFLPEILIPACASSSPAFLMICQFFCRLYCFLINWPLFHKVSPFFSSFCSSCSNSLNWEFCLLFSPCSKEACLRHISSVQFSCVRLFATPWTAACQDSLSITNSRSLLKLMSIESVKLSN